ncbi:hypothetical protein GGF32_004618 [Allomyces javanicus]|nr:hypothetical protein GGF32_004618 [Allomyces javanicus]
MFTTGQAEPPLIMLHLMPPQPPPAADPAPTARKDSVLDVSDPHLDTRGIPVVGIMLPSPADAVRALRRTRRVRHQPPADAPSRAPATANEMVDADHYYTGPVAPPAPFPQPVLRPSPAKRAHVTEIAPAATVPHQGTVATDLAPPPRRRRPRRPDSASTSAPPVPLLPLKLKSVLRRPSDHEQAGPAAGSLRPRLHATSADATKRTVTFAPMATVNEYNADPASSSSSSSSASSVTGAAPDVHADHVAHAVAIDDLFYAAASTTTTSRPATPAAPAAPARASHRTHAFDELWAVDAHLEAANPEHYHPSPWQRPHRYCRPAPAGTCEWPKCPPMIWPAVPLGAVGSRDGGEDEDEYGDGRKAPVAGMCVPQRLRGGRPGSVV